MAAAGALTVVGFDEVDGAAADDPVVLALDAYAAQGLVFVGEPPLVHPEFNFPEDYPATSEPNVLAAGPAADLNAAEGAGGKTTTIEFRNGTVDALTAAFGAQFIDPDFPDYEISRLMAYDAEGELLATVEAIGGDAEAVFVGVVATRDGTPTSEIARIELITGSGYAGVSANEGVVLDDFEFAEPE